jgi:hypothetical protein
MGTDINFKKHLGRTYGTYISLSGSLEQSLINAFTARVAADGGTFEAETCLLNQLTALNNIASDPIQPLVAAFGLRVVTDGGVMEAETCLLNQLTFLNSIV